MCWKEIMAGMCTRCLMWLIRKRLGSNASCGFGREEHPLPLPNASKLRFAQDDKRRGFSDYSEMVPSSRWARRTRSTEHGARRAGLW